jgi:hypothetical protein
MDAAWDAARDAAWDAVGGAARDAAWDAVGDAAGPKIAALESYAGIWLPFVDAYEAGLWLFWLRPQEVVAVPRPAIRIADNRLHCANGPAVFWPNGTRYWFWRGVRVPRDWIESPELLDPRAAIQERNTEWRRCLYEIIGYERILSSVGAYCVAQDAFGELLEADLDDDDGKPARFVRVRCPSTGREYVNRVRPTARTPREALASRWRLKASEYEISQES